MDVCVVRVASQLSGHGQNAREKEATLQTLEFYALLMRPATGSRRYGGFIRGVDLFPFGPSAVWDDCLVDGIPWTFGTGSADVSGIVIFWLFPRSLPSRS